MPGDEQKAYDLFLSYHWLDHDMVEPMAHALRQEGLDVFLDRWYLVPGLRWQTALERAILAIADSQEAVDRANGVITVHLAPDPVIAALSA